MCRVEAVVTHILFLVAILIAASAVAEPLPKVALIIDDVGYRLAEGERAVRLPGAVAVAVLPFGTHSVALAREASAQGKEVVLHLPMQPLGRRRRSRPRRASDRPVARRARHRARGRPRRGAVRRRRQQPHGEPADAAGRPDGLAHGRAAQPRAAVLHRQLHDCRQRGSCRRARARRAGVAPRRVPRRRSGARRDRSAVAATARAGTRARHGGRHRSSVRCDTSAARARAARPRGEWRHAGAVVPIAARGAP